MSKAAVSVNIYSYYLFLMGAALLLIPNVLLQLLGFEATTEIWIRLLGAITFALGIYYFYSSLHEQTFFYKATIVGRLFFFTVTLSLTFLFSQPITLALIGGVDLIGAAWTLVTLQKKNLIAEV